jgi:hypothetical protein
MGEPDIYHLRSFEDLLYDAVHLLYLAHDVDIEKDPRGYDFTYTRSSIINTLFLFECAANCCVEALRLPGAFEEDIDKLPFLSKYGFFLTRVQPDRKFDRGSKEVQAVAELKALRDSYVHAKVKKQKYSKVEDFWNADFGETALLKIPRNPKLWHSTHAILALKSANDFFNLFFLDWCKFDSNTVCEMLLGSDPAEIPSKASIGIDCTEELSRAVLDFKIDFKFVGKMVGPS